MLLALTLYLGSLLLAWGILGTVTWLIVRMNDIERLDQ